MAIISTNLICSLFNLTGPAPYSVYWEICTLDGLKVLSTSELNGRWDVRYNGYLLPHGAYLYYIELTISGKEPVIYTGWLEMMG